MIEADSGQRRIGRGRPARLAATSAALQAACLLLLTAAVDAQVVTDGSLGAATAIAGPNYFVDDALGQTRGANLFHSFSAFNLASGQSATFESSGPILNIIARVTGPGASSINGLVNANANLFLLNPRGVILNGDATLNVAGSVHISTADYLSFGSDRFYASLGSASALSFAAPTAFGFLDGATGALTINGADLQGADNRTLSFIGGDIAFDNASLSVQQGRINIAAVGSAGEVPLGASDLDATSFSTMGTLRMRQTLINAFDEPGTSIYIRGGQFVVENNSLIVATADQAGQTRTIDVDVDRLQLRSSAIASQGLVNAAGPSINLRADQIDVADGSAVLAASDGSGVGGDVNVEARAVTMSGGFSVFGTGSVSGSGGAGNLTIRADTIDLADGGLSAVTAGPGDAGDITLIADRVALRRGVAVTSGTTAAGDGGRISITARELTLEGDATGRPVITATSNAVFDGGDAGDIVVDAAILRLTNGHITSSTAGPGVGGAVTIRAGAATLEQGATITSETGVVGAFGPASVYGDGGSIDLTADFLQILSGSRIGANTLANGAGGAITIGVDRLLINGEGAGVSATTGGVQNTQASGAGGSIVIDAARAEVLAGAAITTNAFGRGRAGRIDVSGGDLLVSSGASITASSLGQTPDAGAANDIRISVDRLALDQGAQITNATHGSGDAGRLLIEAGDVSLTSGAVLQSSSLSSSMDAGAVGDLFISADSIAIDDASIQAHSAGAATPGSIALRSRVMTLDHGAFLTALSTGSGDAGNIGVYASEALDVRGFSRITTEAQNASGGNIALITDATLRMHNAQVSTSVLGGDADGGNVLLGSSLLLLDDSTITARAVGGDGGRIDIASDFLLRSARSVIDASSELGIDGVIGVFGADVNLNADIAPLPSDFLNAQRWLPQPCASRLGTDVSQLTLDGRDGAYRTPGDLASSPLALASEASAEEPLTRASGDLSLEGEVKNPPLPVRERAGVRGLFAATDPACRQ